MSLELPRHVVSDDPRVCKCPHCGRLLVARDEALNDPLFFTKDGLYRGFGYHLPPLLHDTVAGLGMLLGGITFGYYQFSPLTKWSERIVPNVRARPILLPLTTVPPLALGIALCAGLGKAILPGFVELCMETFLGPSEAIAGAVNDVKKHRWVRAASSNSSGNNGNNGSNGTAA